MAKVSSPLPSYVTEISDAARYAREQADAQADHENGLGAADAQARDVKTSQQPKQMPNAKRVY